MEEIPKFDTPESYEQFAINVQERSPERAQAARRKAIELRAEQHGAETAAEREALEAVYAYERMLWMVRGKKVRASRTWQMIERRGIIEAVERVVTARDDTVGYRLLTEHGLEDKAFEAVVLRHPEAFSPKAVAAAKERLERLQHPD